MDGESEVGSAENGSNVDEEQNAPAAMTDELFAELTTKTATVISIFLFIYFHFFPISTCQIRGDTIQPSE